MYQIGNASIEPNSICVYLNIGSWAAMVKVREALRRWLPDLPVWRSSDHWVEKGYCRNNFRWDGEYILNLPLESQKDVEKLVRFRPKK